MRRGTKALAERKDRTENEKLVEQMPLFTLSVTASVVAWYAAIVSTVAVFLQVAQLLRDRVKVKIRFQREMEIIGDPFRAGYTFTLLEIVNAGRRPVTITNVTFTYLPGGGAVATDVNPQLPSELTEGGMARAFLNENDLQFDEINAFQAHDAVGRTYRVAFAPWWRRVYWFFRRLVLGKKKVVRAH